MSDCLTIAETAARPVRVRRERKRGWRLPENTIVVTRPTSWGNPFAVGRHYKRGADALIGALGRLVVWTQAYEGYQDDTFTTIRDASEAVEWFEWYVGTWSDVRLAKAIFELRGRNLACWCALDAPCHADVLLRIANA